MINTVFSTSLKLCTTHLRRFMVNKKTVYYSLYCTLKSVLVRPQVITTTFELLLNIDTQRHITFAP